MTRLAKGLPRALDLLRMWASVHILLSCSLCHGVDLLQNRCFQMFSVISEVSRAHRRHLRVEGEAKRSVDAGGHVHEVSFSGGVCGGSPWTVPGDPEVLGHEQRWNPEGE